MSPDVMLPTPLTTSRPMCPEDDKPSAPEIEASESKTYRQLLLEVEGICRDIARPDLDLDEMISKVERGYLLISKMRERLDRTRTKIDQLRGEMEGQNQSGSDTRSP